MSQEEKENILRKIYYNEDGFGSIRETAQEAKKQLNSITVEYTKKVRTKREYKLNRIKVLNIMLLMSPWKKYKLTWQISPEALLKMMVTAIV